MRSQTMLATCVLWAAVGCYAPSKTGAACEEGSLCDNGQLCSNGSCGTSALDAPRQVDACVDAVCAGEQLVGCGQPQDCALGCTANPDGKDAHCIELKPSNGFTDWAITDGTLPLTVTSDLTVDTETGAISEVLSGGPTVVRSAGVGLRDGIYFATTPGGGPSVFAMHNLTIAAGAALRLVGAPAAVLLIDGDAVIAGRLDVSAGLDPIRPAGPGGGSGGVVATPNGGGCGGGKEGGSASPADGGGGGGGFSVRGGRGGGDILPVPLGGSGGELCAVVDLQPLVGGSGGGLGGSGSAIGSLGGHGGGAVQISVRNRLLIESTGIVVGSGSGGGGGSSGNAGGGGGGGGGVLLEAPSVTITGKLFANGGGGGGGAANSNAGSDGARGNESTEPAQGGSGGGGTNATLGGAGGALVEPRDGRSSNGGNGGGGGGSAGVIVVRSANAVVPALASPRIRQLPIVTQ